MRRIASPKTNASHRIAMGVWGRQIRRITEAVEQRRRRDGFGATAETSDGLPDRPIRKVSPRRTDRSGGRFASRSRSPICGGQKNMPNDYKEMAPGEAVGSNRQIPQPQIPEPYTKILNRWTAEVPFRSRHWADELVIPERGLRCLEELPSTTSPVRGCGGCATRPCKALCLQRSRGPANRCDPWGESCKSRRV